jgi:DNA-binding response OmpR family regulator
MPSEPTRIVVVEDHASMSQAIELVLQAGGFATVSFVSAEAALEADVATTADGLVLDVHLPGMSGFDLYRQLALSGKTMPTIFITARDEPTVRGRSGEAGRCRELPSQALLRARSPGRRHPGAARPVILKEPVTP